MKRIGLLGLALIAASALGGTTASTSQAVCFQTAEENVGEWVNPNCTGLVGAREFIRVKAWTRNEGGGVFCVETTELKGNKTLPNCSVPTTAGRYIRAFGRLVWVGRQQNLAPNIGRPIRQRLKGKARLSIPSLPFTIECKASESENSSIENQGKTHQGQDKGRFTDKECTTSVAECKVAEPITTNQTKSYLAVAYNQAKVLKAVDVFTPTKGKVLAEIKFSAKGCGVLAGTEPIDGSVAAEVEPEEAEAKENLFVFPEMAFNAVTTESGEEKVGLTVGGLESTLSATYGAELESGEEFGVGG
jgi:hypothetical protein